MSGAKHPKTHTPSDADLKGNPGIGSSKGAQGEDERIGGENSFEGDVTDDVNPQGGIDPDQRGRTNK